MIRECNASDLETLEAYLKEEVYGKVILSLIEKNGFEQAAQSVYGDFEEGVCKGVYLCIYKNLLLYCKENQVDIDFLEQIVSMQVPEVVAGRPDNVNVISWLLTKGSCHAGTSGSAGAAAGVRRGMQRSS